MRANFPELEQALLATRQRAAAQGDAQEEESDDEDGTDGYVPPALREAFRTRREDLNSVVSAGAGWAAGAGAEAGVAGGRVGVVPDVFASIYVRIFVPFLAREAVSLSCSPLCHLRDFTIRSHASQSVLSP